MLTFEKAGARFNFRVAGIALHQNKVLLERFEGESFWTVPGGRGEWMEPTEATLLREMQEELAVDVKVERLLWVVENFYGYERRKVHEVCFYYLMSFPKDHPLLEERETFLRYENDGQPFWFQWHMLDSLSPLALYPSFLKEGLQELPTTVVHKVHRDVDH